ncbi:hypothetical protein GCM10020367_31620 [Streptomyces sannanensis]|uniref:Subtilisin inhibitor domain-containing protein n=1 Tax=Streptomyces sannanensis TaxID=285536 RepID=A0ABP6SC20_9ACTN
MLRRLTIAAAAATLSALSAAPADAWPLPAGPERLTVTAGETGKPEWDGTYELECAPAAAGTHPAAAEACARLLELAAGEADPFAPVPTDTMCTFQYGGPATARIHGTWRGKPVDATFSRSNGCEVSRWNNLEPVLPVAVAS